MTSQPVTRQLKLHSPTGSEPAIFTWPPNEQNAENSASTTNFGEEIVQTIRIVFEDYPELYQENLALDRCDANDFTKVKELTERFNKIMDTYVKLNRGTEAFCARLEQRATPKLFRHLLNQIYNRAVTNPEKLRDYEPFSPSVYGETSPELIDSILKVLNLTEDDCFVDLGSGVGNVVLQVAALANCKSVYGIEYETVPASYASTMGEEFRFWMRWYGKCYSDFVLEQGDFLQHPQIDEKIREADVIFVNNYVFGSTVNHELKMKFIHMKDGARIVSSREFCPETFRLNNRTKNDLGAVMHVTKPEAFLGKVSWSDKSVQYYLQTIDHRKLAHYYEKVNNRRLKHQNSKSTEDEHSSSSSETSSTPRSVREPIKRKRRSSTTDHEIPGVQNQTNTPIHRDPSPIDDDRRSLLLIDSYLDSFRNRLKNYFYYMKSNIYRDHIEKQLNEEKELNQQLKTKVNCLENNVKTLLEDAIRLLRLRTQELGIEKLDQPEQLLTYANQISSKHKDLRIKIAVLEKEIADYDYQNDQINTVLSKIAANDTHFTIPTGIHQDIVTSQASINFRARSEQFERSQPASNRWDRNVTMKDLSEQSSHPIKNRSATEVGSKIKISLTEIGSYDSLLSTKALEPVQVHSIVSSRATLNKHGRTTMKSKLDDELLTSDDSLGQSPRKKRDFYGKTAETDLKSSANISKEDSPVSNPT